MNRPSIQVVQHCILALLHERGAEKTICPSEVARRLAPNYWRTLMNDVRVAGAQLAANGHIGVTQKGCVVDPETVQGAIRYKLSK